ncbi:TAXI family TRAP transporter solute-binding subunit [Halomarina halobia]|uniref:TAXI family TRAP transporter solute-binding subunit n=1 Tax=Halomarina halobia TaxID=3033386 RepID=A0ABD6AEB7_9EURY|nr:TAXI family TRAP transporter solute-binding subunit [Halomarina sp. PSR21]
MSRRLSRRRAVAGIGAAATFGLAGCTSRLNELGGGGTNNLRMATSTSDTSAYQMSQGIAAVVNEKSDSINLDARPSDGAKQSMRLMDKGELDMAYTDTLNAHKIVNEEGEYADDPFDSEIQQVFHYYDIQGGLVSRKSSGIETVNDLAGRAVSPNPVGTAMRDVMMTHLSHAEGADKMDQLALGYGEEASALKQGRADVVTDIRINAQLTPSYVQEQYSIVDDAWLLHWPDDVVESIKGDDRVNGSYYPASEMEGPEYGDRSEEWWTDTVYVVFTKASVPADPIYELLSTMWENMEELAEYHALAGAWADKSFLSGKLNPNIPLHDGAKKFFDEIGASY